MRSPEADFMVELKLLWILNIQGPQNFTFIVYGTRFYSTTTLGVMGFLASVYSRCAHVYCSTLPLELAQTTSVTFRKVFICDKSTFPYKIYEDTQLAIDEKVPHKRNILLLLLLLHKLWWNQWYIQKCLDWVVIVIYHKKFRFRFRAILVQILSFGC